MDTLSNPTGFPDANNNEARLQEELHQAQVQTQLDDRLLKQSKGPSAFRKVLGALAGAATGFLVPGLGGAIGNMIIGGNRNVGPAPGAGLTLPDGTAGLDEIENQMQQNAAATEKLVSAGIQSNQNEMAEIAAMPKGPDPVAVLALTEKTNEQSEIFQATSAVAKAKHEAAMAAIQNIKD